MRTTLSAVVLSLAALTIVLSSALASGPPSRTPDAKAVPVLGTAKVSLLQGIKQVQAKYGRVIEAKFELDDSGALSLSVYPAKGFDVFKEVSGPATASPWKPSVEVIKAREDVVNSTFDLTILQQSSIGLATAVQRALAQQKGIAYWAIPTLHVRQPAIGVYIRSSDGKSHHLFIPVS
jgi:protein-disulfide isomerase